MSMLGSIRRLAPTAALAAVFAFSPAVAFAQDGTPDAGGAVAPYDESGAEGIEGTIEIAGSSTVRPITELAGEEFSELAPDVQINLQETGTGGGFELFCNGETDLQNASRPIEEDEAALCAENGVEYYTLEVAFDGLTFVVPEQNDFLTCLSTTTLAGILTGEFANWNEVNPEFPDLEISIYGPDTESGTYDYVNEEILGENEAGEVIEPAPAGPYQTSSDDNVLVQGVTGTEGALGYFGFAYFDQNRDGLKAVEISEGDTTDNCVAPSIETIADGSYTPLSRPLYLYVNAESLADSEALQEYLRYYVANATQLATEVGYVAIPETTLADTQETLESAISGEGTPDSGATPAS